MDTLHDVLVEMKRSTLRLLLVLAIVAVAGAGVAAALGYGTMLTPWCGGVAGLVLYGYAYVWLMKDASDETYERLNLKGRVLAERRRPAALVAALLWCTALIVGASVLPPWLEPLFGAVQVMAVLTIVTLWMPTVEDVEHQQALAEAAAAEQVDHERPAESGSLEGMIPRLPPQPGGDIPRA